jgi:hypothetical protein
MLEEITKDSDLCQKYLDTSYSLIKAEFDADIVIPKAIDLILSKGKNPIQYSEFDLCAKFVNREFAVEIEKLEKAGKMPVYGIGEFEACEVHYLDGAKQELVKKIKTSRKNQNVKALF